MITSSPSTPASASLSSGSTREGDAADDGLSIAFSDVGYRRRRGNRALHNVIHIFRPETITGLSGRNGSGKSMLLDLAAEMRRLTRGSVSTPRLNAVEDFAARSSICPLGTRRGLLERAPVKDSLALWEATRSHWNWQDVEQYLSLFEVSVKSVSARLSQGQRSALDAVFALACHCPVLLLDEIQLGMDAVVRRTSWNVLLDLYVRDRPTIIIPSREIDDIEGLVEGVVVLQQGGLVAAVSVDELRVTTTAPDAPLVSLTDALMDMTNTGPTTSTAH